MNTENIKNKFSLLAIISGFLILFPGMNCLQAQTVQKERKAESLVAFTDRNMYISGEKVRFAVYDYSKDTLGNVSTVVYGEIITPDGAQVAGGKYEFKNRKSAGCLTIPRDQISGNYYLRVYTKYLRNFGPDHFYYVPITIVNPLSSNVMESGDTTGVHTAVENGFTDHITIATGQKAYSPHQQIDMNIGTQSMDTQNVLGLSLSIVPQQASPAVGFTPNSGDADFSHFTYYPESRGPAISGIVKDSITGKPIPAVTVNLSIIGKGRDFMAAQTDKNGHFNLSLPFLDGSRDLFISSGSTSDRHPQIWVDNDFSTANYSLPTHPFNMSESQKEEALKMARNQQVSSLFVHDTVPCHILLKQNDTSAFYGTPSYVLNLSDYIQLPTIEEYCNELPTQLKVRKKDGKKYFKILGPQPGMEYFKPLVLVDMVAIDNPELILHAAPSEFSRIDVVNKIYVKGDFTYGGVVNFISKRNDFAGIDLPNSGLFIHYLFLSDTCHCQPITPPDNKPDARNTVYWNPNVKLDKQVTKIAVKAPDTPGTYTIIVQGVTKDGKTIIQKTNITVNK
ncbi:MAG: hypothetical protein JXR71_04810 [Bacteroidales bacterium]|nr:hypothetical protein [Bacteroidales bacterium]